MDSIRFCEGPFSIFPVVKFLKSKEASYKLICDNWELFGYSLGLNKAEIESLRGKQNSGRIELLKIPRELLRLWKDGHKEDANLQVLYDALIDVNATDLAGSVLKEFGRTSDDVVVPPAPKKFRRMTPEHSLHEVEAITVSENAGYLNISDIYGDFPLLAAIRDGKSHAVLKQLFDDGANPNVKKNDDVEDNAAHEVIESLIGKVQNTKEAVAILDLLVSKGFNLINEPDSSGFTPLHFLMQFEDLDDQLLRWFFNNGADFNAVVDDQGESVLFKAIAKRQSAGIIRKLLDYGCDPKHVNKWKENALHKTAKWARESVMEIFIEKLNVNCLTEGNRTPLHLLFMWSDLNYQDCLNLLLRNGADFEARNYKDLVPMVEWLKRDGGGNPFPTLMKMKDRLPVTQEVASATLTAIVEEMGRLQKFLSSSSSSKVALSAFEQFIAFLVKDKNAKLCLKDEARWKQKNWGVLSKLIITRSFLQELRTAHIVRWNDDVNQMKATVFGNLEFHSKSRKVPVSIETVIVSLLASKNFKGLVELCKASEDLCESRNGLG